jgi:hypothetical protein
MSLSRAENLISKLIGNKLSGNELSEIFDGLNDENERQKYSDALEIYFGHLVQESEQEVDSQKCSDDMK